MKNFLDIFKEETSLPGQIRSIAAQLGVYFKASHLVISLSDTAFLSAVSPVEWVKEGSIIKEDISTNLLKELKLRRISGLTYPEQNRQNFISGNNISNNNFVLFAFSISSGIPEIEVAIVRDEEFTRLELNYLNQILSEIAPYISKSRKDLLGELKQQEKQLTALYRLSHELSAFLSLDEIYQKAFEIMKSELGIDRFWLGLLNETGTRLIGASAFGSGWKRKLIEINIDVSGDRHPISKVIQTKRPIILKETGSILRGLGIKRFILRNEIDSVGLVPLVAGGQVLGLLAFEGEREGVVISNKKLSLLYNFASELASVLLAKKLEERVLAGETMRAAGLLASGIAHNFNNVLQGILGQASLIELYSEKPEQVKKSSAIISEAATKGASLVKQLLSFAHLEEAVPNILDVNLLIERSKASFQRTLKNKQYIKYQLESNLPKAYVDSSHLIRIIQVLLSNARDAMPEDGRVEILSDYIVVDKNSPHYEVPFGRYVRIGVRDNGIGMDLETKKRCFEPFFTTKNTDPSTGLSLSGGGMGLSAAFALARKNGGRLVVDSRKGHGSLFTLYIPEESALQNKVATNKVSPDKVTSNKSIQEKVEVIQTENKIDSTIQIENLESASNIKNIKHE